MSAPRLSRRHFLQASKQWAQGSFIVLSTPAILAACQRSEEVRTAASEENPASEFAKLSAAEASEVTAIAARIIPTDDTPGATEAGVVYFIDTVLADDRETEYSLLQEGLRELQFKVASDYGAAYFSELTEEQQDQVLTEIEATPFFDTMRYLTIAGTFCLPEYGGNRNRVGYDLIGFSSQHAWTAPYGYYDADYMEKGA